MVKNIIPETLAFVTEKYEYSTDTHTTVQRNTRKPTNYNVGDEDAAHRRQFVVRSGRQEHYAMSSVCVCVCVRARHAVRYVCVCVFVCAALCCWLANAKFLYAVARLERLCVSVYVWRVCMKLCCFLCPSVRSFISSWCDLTKALCFDAALSICHTHRYARYIMCCV